MKRRSLLYFLAFACFTCHAQSVKRSARPVKQPLSIKPLVGKPLPNDRLPITNNQLAQLIQTREASLATHNPEVKDSPPKAQSSVDQRRTPIQVANPMLIETIRTKPYLLPIDRAAIKGSYPLGISDRKTTHIIFPAAIKEFDAGTDYVLAQVPETVTNVLRVKANPKATAFCRPDSGRETNMTVMTTDGGFYSFLIRYQEEPEILNINMANNLTADEYTSRTLGINQATAITFAIAPSRPDGPTLSESDMQHQCERVDERKSFIRNIGASSMRMTNLLTGIYVGDKVMYLQFTLRNDSQIDYEPDFLKFYVRDKQVIKRMAAQEIELKPYGHYPDTPRLLRSKSEYKLVYALPLTTLHQEKVLDVELYEKNGGRHLRFQVESDVLLLAKPL